MSVAFLFPGQGGQFVGMLNYCRDVSCVRALFEEASDILKRDLWSLVEHGPIEELSLTENTQPAMLVADVALWRMFEKSGKVNKESDIWLAGHSLGEYAALVASGVLSFADALRSVCYRAAVMQDAVPKGQGAMAAVLGLSADEVMGVCNSLSTCGAVVEVVNFNNSSQTVIGGHHAAVEKASVEIKRKGAKKVIFLDMSVPSHSSLMIAAKDKMRDFLETITFFRPTYPVVHNLTADICHDHNLMKDILAEQLSSPVRWSDTIAFIQRQSVRRFVQCGPGNVMVGLLRKIPCIEIFLSSDYCPVDCIW
ncbi:MULTISPECIES: ACP S-malonyltransferase [Candidatus Ichthyocystis]|uniref:Malonyl CoA-acyl carrier protein transacylase n=1 Tax=Candidatus Ichthyocystis hellenicum TaxID=1561003 RepID=A0A0S4M1E7_9BURK|nr:MULTISPECIES: ACP S-malonyltransferase [Ichthyocystis]CUT17593.1 ACP S-malonyltransferase [Candidatus Ichthyocystis hellenicum]